MGKEVALVTGANRGIGFEVCRQLGRSGMQVHLTARSIAKAEEAACKLRAEGLDIVPHVLDVTDIDTVMAVAASLEQEPGRLDVLVNNAGIDFDYETPTLEVVLDEVQGTLDANLYGPWRMVQTFEALLRKSETPRIVNVSSEAGSFAADEGMPNRGTTLAAYGVSKAALNALTVKLAEALKEDGFKVNAVCPGFTATQPGLAEMGARPVDEGAASVVWAATLPKDGPTGGFFRDGEPLAW